jgi:hypothetical protein
MIPTDPTQYFCRLQLWQIKYPIYVLFNSNYHIAKVGVTHQSINHIEQFIRQVSILKLFD